MKVLRDMFKLRLFVYMGVVCMVWLGEQLIGMDQILETAIGYAFLVNDESNKTSGRMKTGSEHRRGQSRIVKQTKKKKKEVAIWRN